MKKYVQNIINILESTYPNAECTLNYDNALQLMVATILAAQCTDARVNVVMRDIVNPKYKTAQDFADADLHQLEQDIHSTGFFRNKAKNIIAACKRLVDEYNGQVPDNMEDLLTLPGVGRKTANLILGDVFKIPGIVVDTHCGRLARRMGLTKNKDPHKVELDLLKIIPSEKQTSFCHNLVNHGREYCKSQRPLCDKCPLSSVCLKILE